MKRVGMRWVLATCVCFWCFTADAIERANQNPSGNTSEASSQIPEEIDSVADMFLKGTFSGRLRLNSFLWKWEQETAGKTRDHWSVGIGGSMIFKSAYLHGIGLTGGLYTSQNPWHMGGDDYRYAKPARDTFSRYSVATRNGWDMTVLTQAYLEYRLLDSNVRVGRQLFESLLTSANDTKMIPNAFRGISFESGDIPGTQVKAAWFNGQKLRDHTTFHHVLAYGDDPNMANAGWTQNDDTAMHKGLTLSKLRDAGIEDRLIILQAENKTTQNLTILANYTDVPDLLGYLTGELNYKFDMRGGFKFSSGIRFLSQQDSGGGNIGGASLTGKVSDTDARGYRNPSSLAGSMFAAKISVGKGAASLMVGYSKIADNADLVAPWRGFPTGGYTRAMGQYNWYANTESWMLQADYDFGKAGLVSGFTVKARYVIQDNDDLKPDVPADSRVLNIDLTKKIAALPGLELKMRTNFVSGDTDTVDMEGTTKANPAYNEGRFEINYLF